MSTEQRVMSSAGRVPTQGNGRGGAEAEAAAAPAKKKKGKLVVVVAVVVLALGAAAYFFLLAPGDDHAAEAEAAHEPVELGEVVQAESVSLNLADGHYLRLGIALQLTAEVHGEVNTAQALDHAIALFSGRKIAEVTDPATRDHLKAELVHKLEKTYHGDVVDVYLTEYVTQ